METLFKQITFHFPFSSVQIQVYFLPLLFTLFFIPFSFYHFLKKGQSKQFYPYSQADFSLRSTKDHLFKVEDFLSFIKLLIITIFALTIPAPAFLEPQNENQMLDAREIPPKEGSALFLLLDQSGSMGENIRVNLSSMRKIDFLKEVTKNFVHDLDAQNPDPQRKDMIGLVGFARLPQVIIPPTFEHDVLINALDHFDVLKTQEGQGTSVSYSIYKTANLIHFLQQKIKGNQNFTLDSSAIILITDGVEMISPNDVNNPYISISLDAASTYAAENHIPLYLIIIDPELKGEKYAPERRNLQKAATRTLGGLYVLDHANEVEGVLSQIRNLEKKAYYPDSHFAVNTVKIPLWPFFLKLGFILTLLYIYLEFYKYRSSP